MLELRDLGGLATERGPFALWILLAPPFAFGAAGPRRRAVIFGLFATFGLLATFSDLVGFGDLAAFDDFDDFDVAFEWA